MISPLIGGLQKTTNYKVVLPFYIYASIGFLAGTILLFFSTDAVNVHHFSPHTLAVTHTMALAWGTMIIFGASHQLLPVLIEGKLDSDLLAFLTFGFSAIGIPILIAGFYIFDTGLTLQIGGFLINIAVIFYMVNVVVSSFKSSKRNVHAWFVISASIWLFSTTFFGLLLVFNFSYPIFNKNSVDYLAVHAHLGIVGWFILLVIGVGSRLIPMFLISKYTNDKILWLIFGLMNGALVLFIVLFLLETSTLLYYIPIGLGLLGIVLFGRHCYKAYQVRIRRGVDQQVRTSLISVAQMVLPILALIVALAIIPNEKYPRIAILYGFCIFFGWLTAIILGMTFKTMPFIIWNRTYRNSAHRAKTPAPKELFNDNIFKIMLYSYLTGFIVFIVGIIILNQLILKIGALALITAAILYVYNVFLTITHKPKPL